MSVEKTKKAAEIFKALATESRLKIILLLNEIKEACVSEIAKKTGFSTSAVSHQLKELETAGFVSSFRMGKNICYFFKKTRFNREILKCLKALL